MGNNEIIMHVWRLVEQSSSSSVNESFSSAPKSLPLNCGLQVYNVYAVFILIKKCSKFFLFHLKFLLVRGTIETGYASCVETNLLSS